MPEISSIEYPEPREEFNEAAALSAAERRFSMEQYVDFGEFVDLPPEAQSEGYKILAAGNYIISRFLLDQKWEETAGRFWNQVRELAKKVYEVGEEPKLTEEEKKEEEELGFGPYLNYEEDLSLALSSYRKLKRGIIAQVGTFKILERLGLNPVFAKPEEDQRWKIDFRLSHPKLPEERFLCAQTKYRGDLPKSKPIVFLLDENTSKESISNYAGEVYYRDYRPVQEFLQDTFIKQVKHSQGRLKELGKSLNKKVECLYFIISRGCLNRNTGEPNDDALKKIRENLNNLPEMAELLASEKIDSK